MGGGDADHGGLEGGSQACKWRTSLFNATIAHTVSGAAHGEGLGGLQHLPHNPLLQVVKLPLSIRLTIPIALTE